MKSPSYALVDNDDAQVALPDQLPAVTLGWFSDFSEAFEAALKDGNVVVFRVVGDGCVWKRIG
jgi:hypothetical protein